MPWSLIAGGLVSCALVGGALQESLNGDQTQELVAHEPTSRAWDPTVILEKHVHATPGWPRERHRSLPGSRHDNTTADHQENTGRRRMFQTKKLLFIAASMAAMICSDVLAQVVQLPPVVVVGSRVGGGNILCRGDACAGVLADLQQRGQGLYQEMYEYQMLPEDVEVDPGQMCQELRQAKPAGCSASNPPPSPGIGNNWQPNGCGTGGLANVFTDVFLEIVTRPTYSGNQNAPFAGVSFLSACNAHDLCWASANPKAGCDFQFRQDMINACGGASSANNNCLGFAGLYHGAVSNTGASQTAYTNSVNARACALWASDMRENGCGG
ncbi:MAG: hypothetical protein IPK97_02090 [Ahniella sp.]|nr:hypothetical protein [Ahniella sp.]